MLLPMKKIIFLILICVTYTNSFSSDKKTISGRVIDELRFPVSGITVTLNSGVSVTTDKLGKFTITNVDLPYIANLSDASNSTYVTYTDLSVTNPDLILFNRKSSKDVNLANVDVLVDDIPANSKGIIKFISQNTSYSEDEIITSGENKKQITVKWPAGEKSINGNIVYIEKNSGRYTRYAERNVTLYNDLFQQSFKMTGVLGYDAVNTSNLTVFLPSKTFSSKYFTILGEFMGYDRNSQIELISQTANIQSADTYVPSMLPFNFKLKVKAECYNEKGDGFVNYTYTYPGSTVNLTSEEPPVLISPSNEAKFLSGNTLFSYMEGSSAGIYVVHIHCLNPDTDNYIVTKSREVLYPAGSIASNANFNWNVSKYIPYFSVNDLVSPKMFNNEYTYQAISYSKTYSFKTN